VILDTQFAIKPFQENIMEATQTLNRLHEAIAWGAIFLWWGITELLELPNGMDALGIGLILLTLMAVRSGKGLSTNGLTIMLGVLSVAWGILDLMSSLLRLPFKLPTFPTLLVVLGVTLIALALVRGRRTTP
jgi:hypothetical protein